MRPKPIVPRPGQESVWDYPRPPRLERVSEHIRIVFGGQVLVDTTAAHRVLETSHPPTYYLPECDVVTGALVPAGGGSICEWKGPAFYYDVVLGGRRAPRAGWTYPAPLHPYEAIVGHVAFYAGPMDGCFVGDERVEPQPGGFYGGWVTGKVAGPFKGEPGTSGW
jgi:uncharacterized protein (DUF427 family)